MTQRVRSLRFRITCGDDTRYEIANPEEFTNIYGRFLMEQDWLTIWPREEFEHGEDARAALFPYLRAWELQSDLDCGPGCLRFDFESAEVEESAHPASSGGRHLTLSGHSVALFSDQVTTHLTRMRYPERPDKFGVSQFVELAHHRWFRHLQGREPLPAMAYFIYTILEQLGGSRKGAAAMFQIDQIVLSKLSELSTLSGDAHAMRKFQGVAPPVQMPDVERAWLEAVTRRVIRRLGEHAAGGSLERIKMTDFPTLR